MNYQNLLYAQAILIVIFLIASAIGLSTLLIMLRRNH